MPRRYEKDPAVATDYKLDWSIMLNGGETISTSNWSDPAGIDVGPDASLPAPSISGNQTTVWVGGGTEGLSYVVANTITTNQSRTLVEPVIFDIVPASQRQILNLPVDLIRLKQHLRISHDMEDDLLRDYIRAAEAWVETRTGQTFITKTHTLRSDAWLHNGVELPQCPLLGVTAVKYLDATGVTQIVDPANYYIVRDDIHGTLRFRSDFAKPTLYDARVDRVAIEYSSGYGTEASCVPQPAQVAIMMMAGHLNQNRTPVHIGSAVTTIPLGIDALCNQLWSGDYCGPRAA